MRSVAPGRISPPLLALLVLTACNGDILVVPPDDAALAAPDLAAPPPVPDLAVPPPPPDLAELPDLARPPVDMAVPGVPVGAVVINEVHGANLGGLADEDGDQPDWIELYNTTAKPVDLSGVGLGKSARSPYRWTFPAGAAIPAKDYLVVFASKKDRRVVGRPLHASFNVDTGDDRVYLTSPGDVLLDMAEPPRGKPDVSWCRIPDVTGPFQHCLKPTPRARNDGAAYPVMLEPPLVSVPGGFYATDQMVALFSASPGAEIRYTLDGADPTANAPLYTGPIPIKSRVGAPNRYANIVDSPYSFYSPTDAEVYKGTVLRAAAFANGKLSSPINTHTYFIDPNGAGRYPDVPVISLAADPPLYFSSDNPRGIYVPGPNPGNALPYSGANYWLPIEVQTSMEVWNPNRTLLFRSDIGASIAGGWTRNYGQKSMNVAFRDGYGVRGINARLFPNRQYTDIDRLRLRAANSSRGVAGVRDILMGSLMKDSPVGFGDYAPAVLFLEGEYWGYIAFRERTTAGFLDRVYGVPEDAVDVLDIVGSDQVQARSGSTLMFDALRAYLTSHAAEAQMDLDLVRSLVDVENFANYYAANLYGANQDWLGNNVRFWRERSQAGRWRWILQDDDQAFGLSAAVDANNYSWIANGTKTSSLLQTLLKNPDFRTLYINVVADQLNTYFAQPGSGVVFDDILKTLAPLMPEHYARFRPNNQTINDWNNHVTVIRNFLAKREGYLVGYTQQYFGLGNQPRYTLTVNANDPTMGSVKINTLDLSKRLIDVQKPWKGLYFPGVPVTATALPRPGYRFTGWQGASAGNQPTVTLNLNADATLIATFAVDPNNNPPPPPPPEPAGLRNVALGARATQSSTAGLAAAPLAVDGDASGVPANASIAITNSEANAWWQIDLGAAQDLHHVDLFSRTDCCADRFADFHVFVSAADMTGRTFASLVADNTVWKSSRQRLPGPSVTLPVGVNGRYVRVQLAGTNALALAEVRAWAVPAQPRIPDLALLRNLALGQPATQSSDDTGAVAARAVDGNPDGRLASGSLARTRAENQPWWQVDLGAVHPLHAVHLWNRTDCCMNALTNLRVLIAEQPMDGRTPADLDADPNVWKYDVTAAVGAFIQIPAETRGRYVRVQLKGNAAALGLAEVAVLGLVTN